MQDYGDKWGKDKFDLMDESRERETIYMPPSTLKLPERIKERFRHAGYFVKWVRADKDSVRKRMHPSEGYSFVSPDEMEAEELLMLGEIENFGGKDTIRNGDLLLMKVPVEKAEARRKYYADRTKSQADAIEQRLRENAIQHFGTRSVVRTGKNAHFMGD